MSQGEKNAALVNAAGKNSFRSSYINNSNVDHYSTPIILPGVLGYNPLGLNKINPMQDKYSKSLMPTIYNRSTTSKNPLTSYNTKDPDPLGIKKVIYH